MNETDRFKSLRYADEITEREMEEWRNIQELYNKHLKATGRPSVARQEAEQRLGWGDTPEEKSEGRKTPLSVSEVDLVSWMR